MDRSVGAVAPPISVHKDSKKKRSPFRSKKTRPPTEKEDIQLSEPSEDLVRAVYVANERLRNIHFNSCARAYCNVTMVLSYSLALPACIG